MTSQERDRRRPSLDAIVSHSRLVSLTQDLMRVMDGAKGQSSSETQTLTEHLMEAALHAERTIAELSERATEMERLASTDQLTGLLNRRGFEMALSQAAAYAGRYGDGGALIYIDLDGFKGLNDTYGHAAGDLVLQRVAMVLKHNVRETDFVGRLGGDEFVVLLTRTDRDNALARAKVLDERLNGTTIDWQGDRLKIRASLGFHAYAGDSDVGVLLSAADSAMYAVKRCRAATPATRSEKLAAE